MFFEQIEPGDLVAPTGELLLGPHQLAAGGDPLVGADDGMLAGGGVVHGRECKLLLT